MCLSPPLTTEPFAACTFRAVQHDRRRLLVRRGPYPVRPLRRRARRRAARRPWPPWSFARWSSARPTSTRPASTRSCFGNANGAGEDNRNVARMAGLLAGLPTTVPAGTVNRLCGSSLDAAMVASRQIALGEADVVLAGGVESMSRAPWVLPKSERPYPAGRRHPGLDDAGLAAGQQADASGVDRLARRGDRATARAREGRPRVPGRVRTAGRTRRRRRLGGGLLRRSHRGRPRRRTGSRRIDPADDLAGEAGRAQAVVPPGRHGHRGQRLAAQRRCFGSHPRQRRRRRARLG